MNSSNALRYAATAASSKSLLVSRSPSRISTEPRLFCSIAQSSGSLSRVYSFVPLRHRRGARFLQASGSGLALAERGKACCRDCSGWRPISAALFARLLGERLAKAATAFSSFAVPVSRWPSFQQHGAEIGLGHRPSRREASAYRRSRAPHRPLAALSSVSVPACLSPSADSAPPRLFWVVAQWSGLFSGREWQRLFVSRDGPFQRGVVALEVAMLGQRNGLGCPCRRGGWSSQRSTCS